MVNINWPGLLKWSTKYSDGTVDTSKRLSPEDIEFLQGAIKECLSKIEDPYEAMDEAVNNFKSNDEGIILAAAKIVERLLDEYPEIARNLNKINAVDPLLQLIESENVHILESVLQIFSLALSNNPDLQDVVFKKGALKKLLIKLQQSHVTHIDTKLITAISALIRHHNEAENKFIDYGGVGFLVYGMRTNIFKYQEKAALLLKHLVYQNKISYELFVKKEIMSGIICLANNKNIDETGVQFGETTAELILAIIQNHRNKLAKSGDLYKLKLLMENRIKYLQIIQNSASYDVSHEIELFHECLKLTTWPGMKILEQAQIDNGNNASAFRNTQGRWNNSSNTQNDENDFNIESCVSDNQSICYAEQNKVSENMSQNNMYNQNIGGHNFNNNMN